MNTETIEEAVVAPDEAQDLVAELIGSVSLEQSRLGLTDVELAQRANVHRATVARVKSEGDPRLSNFVALAKAVGLMPSLSKEDASEMRYRKKIVHRGIWYLRTKDCRDRKDCSLERAFSRAWARENAARLTSPPLMNELMPAHDQAQASAAATAIQWLGTQVGFFFLCETLEKAGYQVVDERKSQRANRSLRG